MSRVFKGKGLVGGTKEGQGLVSTKAFTFAHGVEPTTGAVTDVRSDIRGSFVKGKVLFYPFGKGSTTASAWFLETARLGHEPAAIVTEGVDLAAVIGSVMARRIYDKVIPVVSGIPSESFSKIPPDTKVRVVADRGEVIIL